MRAHGIEAGLNGEAQVAGRAEGGGDGLGTPATRAAIIEGLILDKYITRDGRDLFVTTRGMRLVEQLHNMRIGILTSPEMTGE